MIAKVIGKRLAKLMIGAVAKRMSSLSEEQHKGLFADTEKTWELTDRHIGKMFKVDDKILPYPKTLADETSVKFPYPYILLTPLRMKMLQNLQRMNNLNDDEVTDSSGCKGLAGSAGAGKTVTLYLNAYAARQMGWITLYLPEGRDFVKSSLNLNPILVEIMQAIYEKQYEILKKVSMCPHPNISASNLYELLKYGVDNEAKATDVFTIFLNQIRRTRHKVFVGVDQWDAYSGNYQYEEGKYKKCEYHPIYRNFVELSSFNLRKGMYNVAVTATLGYFIKRELEDGYQELIYDIVQPTKKEVDTMLEYYISQGMIKNTEKEHYIMLSEKYAGISGGLRMISQLIKGEDYMLKQLHDRTYNSLSSLLNRYKVDISNENNIHKKEALEESKARIFSTCAKIVFRKPGSVISIPEEWVNAGIANDTRLVIQDAVIQACTKFIMEKACCYN